MLFQSQVLHQQKCLKPFFFPICLLNETGHLKIIECKFTINTLNKQLHFPKLKQKHTPQWGKIEVRVTETSSTMLNVIQSRGIRSCALPKCTKTNYIKCLNLTF